MSSRESFENSDRRPFTLTSPQKQQSALASWRRNWPYHSRSPRTGTTSIVDLQRTLPSELLPPAQSSPCREQMPGTSKRISACDRLNCGSSHVALTHNCFALQSKD